MSALARRALAVTAALVAATALIAGCGGGGDEVAPDMPAAELLDRSREAAARFESFRTRFEGTLEVGVEEGVVVPGGALLTGPLELSGEGVVDPPERASLDVGIDVRGLPIEANLTRDGDRLYLSAVGQSFVLVVPGGQVGRVDVGRLYATLINWLEDPERVGGERIDGVATARIRARIDPARALADLAPLLGASAPAADPATLLRRGEAEVWVGGDDLLPRRVAVDLELDGTPVAGPVRRLAIELTVDVSRYGETVRIVAPSGARPLDLDSLRTFVGG